jgi:CRISPR-associated protein (TIGR02584 family)
MRRLSGSQGLIRMLELFGERCRVAPNRLSSRIIYRGNIMEEDRRKNILLCVAGLTPQIITETLYALIHQREERVDEIRVITTLAGRDRIMDVLLDEEKGKFFEFCDDFKIDRNSIRFDRTCIYLLHRPDGAMLEDIRSVSDNEIAANQICEIVRKLTEEPNARIHASAAGGRKTMSVYLTAAMQLFGRAYDELSHVLVSEDFETRQDFFYKPPSARLLEVRDRKGNLLKKVSTDDAEIHLADIPFIRLRGVISEWIGERGRNYGGLVERAQEDLDFLETDYDLQLDPRENSVRVKTRSAALTPREFFVYALFARFRVENSGDGGFVSIDRITTEDLAATFRHITAARGEETGLEESLSCPGYDFLESMARQAASDLPKDREDLKKTFMETFARANRKLEEADLPKRYAIARTGPYKAARYGLNVAAEKIFWL